MILSFEPTKSRQSAHFTCVENVYTKFVCFQVRSLHRTDRRTEGRSDKILNAMDSNLLGRPHNNSM